MPGKEPFFYLDFDARHSMPYIADNGIAESAEKIGEGVYRLTAANATVNIERIEYPEQNAYRQRTVVTNTGDTPLCLDTVSSAFVCGIGDGGTRDWDDDRFILHYAHSAWQGEAQWRHETLRQAGLYKTYNHHTQTSVRLQSYGTWSTQKYHPVVYLEDTELNQTWFFEHEGGVGWEIDIGARGHRENGRLCVFLSAAHEKNNGWFRTLLPGESFASTTAIVGCVSGGFEEAVGALTSLKRQEMCRALPNGVPLLCFNDYMNCLWALPTREKLIPLIRAAAKVGCEYFVIDAGWFHTENNWTGYLGDWLPEDGAGRFGQGGLQGILDTIREAGMLPGVWMEMEAVGSGSRFAAAHPECILQRRGHRIGGDRCLMDFRSPVVRRHIRDAIDRLYKMGVRFIKNDYNQSIGIGPDGDRETLADNLLDHHTAFIDFIEEMAQAYPDLLIESCCSGAMRADFGTVRHFAAQSISDQEDYFRLPSILSGMSACLPPERIGVWAFPCPVSIDDRERFVPNPTFTAQFADGRVTAFTMVTGLVGLCYLSGHIDCADEKNTELICEATKRYKKYRSLLTTALPIYPDGTFDLSAGGVHSFGLLDRAAGKLALAVWTIDDTTQAKIDLSKYTAHPTIADFYPNLPGYRATADKENPSLIQVEFPQGCSACWMLFDLA